MKHTKGEWHAVQYANFWAIQNALHYGAKDLLNAEIVGEKEAEANAKLMASAPFLLKALQFVIAEESRLGEGTTNYIEEAIKKATE